MKPTDKKVEAYERDLPRLLDALRSEADEHHRPAAEEVLRKERFLRSIDAALEAPARSAARRAARPAAALLLAAAAVAGVLALDSLRNEQDVAPISGERVQRSKAPKAEVGTEVLVPSEASAPDVARAPAPVQRSRSNAPARPLDHPGKATASGGAPVAADPVSTLAEENRLFEQAAAAERRGDLSSSLATLDRLVATYPMSPLAQQALVRKFRALQRAARPVEAARAASEYLAAYPNGFAQREAAEVARVETADAGL